MCCPLTLLCFLARLPSDLNIPSPCLTKTCEHGAMCVVKNNEAVCECTEACPQTSDPVCGSDGQSYRSPCEMRAVGCTLQKHIRIQHRGPCVGRGEAAAYLQQSMGGRQGTPWTGRQSMAGQHTMHTLIHTPKGNLERPINLTGMSLDCGRKPEYPERTQECTGRTCELHAERPRPGVEPRTYLLQGNSAPVQPPVKQVIFC
ncbi:hypothetical protein ILYODFUR_009519 [Ilyodon furcidens]|uniref:Kazal-like domain-containing protein n=1 Tax=Ilyodon furcidens TaxID=33524 RepID=A0ABV0VCK0_9TELE